MNPEFATPVLLEMLAKCGAIFLPAVVVDRTWRGASAAQRHLVWFSAIVAVLLLPMTRLVAPRWPVQIQQRAKVADSPSVFSFAPVLVASTTPDFSPVEVSPPSWKTPNWRKLILIGWLSGAVLVFGLRLLGSWRLLLLQRDSRLLDDARIAALAEHILGTLGIDRHVEIRLSGECRVPMTWGSLRPVLMLPTEALAWSDARVKAALLHEAGHVSRHDYLTRWIAQLACAVYWPNPLVWLAARSLRIAQEQATDDVVLRSGTQTEDYALQLCDAARTVSARGFLARHVVAMASPSTLEGRVLAIMDEKRERRPLSRRLAAVGVAAVSVVLAVCGMVQLSGAEKKGSPLKNESSTPELEGKAPQIEIESKFVEITESAATRTAMPWLPVRPESGESHGYVAGVFNDEELQATMKALNQTGGVDLLSTPRVTTRSKQHATIEMVREFRYPTEWVKGTKPEAWKPTAFEAKNIGITLGVDATFNEDGTIDLNLAPEVTNFVGFRDIDAGGKNVFPRPESTKALQDRFSVSLIGTVPSGHRSQAIFSTRKIDASISIREGETVVVELPAKDDTQVLEIREGKGVKKREMLQVKRRLLVFVSAKLIKPVIVEKSVTITSDSQTFDKTKGAVTASGNVKIETPQTVIMAEKVEIKLKPVKGAAPADTKYP